MSFVDKQFYLTDVTFFLCTHFYIAYFMHVNFSLYSFLHVHIILYNINYSFWNVFLLCTLFYLHCCILMFNFLTTSHSSERYIYYIIYGDRQHRCICLCMLYIFYPWNCFNKRKLCYVVNICLCIFPTRAWWYRYTNTRQHTVMFPSL